MIFVDAYAYRSFFVCGEFCFLLLTLQNTNIDNAAYVFGEKCESAGCPFLKLPSL